MLRRSHSAVQGLEIQLEGNAGSNDDIVLLSGPPLEASAHHFFGKIVLSTLEQSYVRRVSIKLVGNLRLRWADNPGTKHLPVKYEKELYSQEFSDFQLPGKPVQSPPMSQRATPVASLTNLASYFGGHKHKSLGSSTKLSSLSREPSPKMSRQSSTTSLINLAGPYIGSNGIGPRSSSHVHLSSLNNASQNGNNGSNSGSGSGGSGLGSAGSSPGASSESAAGNNGKMHVVPLGIHEFPFDLVIPGDINESIEGNDYGQLTYSLVTTVDRGSHKSKLSAHRHIRIVRTVGVDNYDLAHTVSIENTWPKKVDYRIDIPCRAIALGTQLQVNFALVPLDKGLKLGRIKGEIVEYSTLSSPLSPTREEQKVVHQQIFDVPENFDQYADEWAFSHLADIPRSLSRCTQDAFVEPYVKINHKFRCFVSLINRDGHTSELRASLPITIFISPHIYILASDDPNPTTGGSGSSHKLGKLPHHHSGSTEHPVFNVQRRERNGMTTPDKDASAPPVYSNHVYDRLYSAVPTPSESPIQSGAATPRYSPSRPNSPPHSLANLDPSQQAQLNAGLRALALSRQNSYQSMPPLNRTNSSSINLRALSRVPSYEEALNEGAATDAAPNYPDGD